MLSRTKEYRSIYYKKYYLKTKVKNIKKCIVCGTEFNPKGAKNNRCEKCQKIVCKQCGVEFKTDRYDKIYCSKACHIESQKGKEPQGLKSNRGKKPRTYHLKHRDKHGNAFDREWRTNVFKRDNYTCQSCKKVGGRLHAHHIKSYKAHPELRHDLSNGVTLCIDCHKKTDSYGWQNYHKNKIAAQRMCQEVLEI